MVKATMTLGALFLLYLAFHLVAATTAQAHSKFDWSKADEYEYLDRLDGYNDNCIVIDGYAYCLSHCRTNPNDCR